MHVSHLVSETLSHKNRDNKKKRKKKKEILDTMEEILKQKLRGEKEGI